MSEAFIVRVDNETGRTWVQTKNKKIDFPEGVIAVEIWEDLDHWQNTTSPPLERFLSKKKCRQEYNEFLKDLFDKAHFRYVGWSELEMIDVLRKHRARLETKGVNLFFANVTETISSGRAGHYRVHMWLELVDLSVQKDYQPKYSAEDVLCEIQCGSCKCAGPDRSDCVIS